MNDKRSVIIGASIIVASLILSLPFNRPAAGQSAVSPASAGRYQVVVTQQPIGSDCTVFVFEAATGQCWFRSTNRALTSWADLGSPVIKKP